MGFCHQTSKEKKPFLFIISQWTDLEKQPPTYLHPSIYPIRKTVSQYSNLSHAQLETRTYYLTKAGCLTTCKNFCDFYSLVVSMTMIVSSNLSFWYTNMFGPFLKGSPFLIHLYRDKQSVTSEFGCSSISQPIYPVHEVCF